MGFFTSAYTEVIYRPLLNGLVFAYTALPYHDLGLAIFVLTFIVRLILHPTMVHTIRSQRAMARLQPKLKEIQERLKNDKAAQARETMALYKSEGVHPLSGCLPILIQLPILIGLYQVFWKGIKLADPALIYSFVPHVASFNTVAFGFFDLAASNPLLSLTAGASQFLQGKFGMPPPDKAAKTKGDFSQALRFQTTYFLPLVIVFISWSLPSAIALYWTIFNLFAIVQQLWIQRRLEREPGERLSETNS